MYIKTKNGGLVKYPYYVTDFRKDNPNLSFREPIPSELLAEQEIFEVRNLDRPEYNPRTQHIEPETQPSFVNNEWVIGWNIIDFPEEKVTELAKSKRNGLLMQTDYYGLSDQTMTDEMRSYRQALRDLPDHENWPYLDDADWPVKP